VSEERLSYRFGPIERRGLLGPLRPGQVLVPGAALVAGVELLDTVGGGASVVAALALVLVALAVVSAPIGGMSADQWLPVLLAYGVRGARAGRFERSALPTRGLRATFGAGAAAAEPRAHPAPDAVWLGRCLRGVQLRELEHAGRALGALVQGRGRWLTLALACEASSLVLLDPEVQERRLALWGSVLAGAADTPIRRLQWVERTAPAQGDELAHWLHTARDPSIPPHGTPAVDSYLELIGASTQVALEHEILLAVQLDATRLRGRGGELAERAAEQVAQLARGLAAAEIRVLGALTPRQLATALRTAFDPYCRSELGGGLRARPCPGGGGDRALTPTAGAPRHGFGVPVHDPGTPMAASEHWDHYRADGALHATHWISSWPRLDVSPLFMDALLADSATVRTVSVVAEPLAPDRSTREVEAAITRDRADSEIRRRFGQSETARQRQAQQAAARREAELAAGHGEVRFNGFVTVSGRDERELRRGCAEIHRLATRAHLELRRLYGRQAEAFTYTLPLARGLR